MSSRLTTADIMRRAVPGRVDPPMPAQDANGQRIPGGMLYEQSYPRAADVERRCLTVLRERLWLVATALSGPRDDRAFRASLEGETTRYFRLSDLCRLATEPTREPREAVLGVLTELAQVLGYRLEPARPGGDPMSELADSIAATGELHSEYARAAADGVITPEEVLSLRPKFEEAKKQLAEMEATLGGGGAP